MNKFKAVLATQVVLLTFVLMPSLFAQYTIVSEEFDVPWRVREEVLSKHPNIDSPAVLPATVFIEAAERIKEPLEIEVTTVYLHPNGSFAMETTGCMGKMTWVYKKPKETTYQILWPQKKVIKMSKAELAAMTKQAKGAMSEMEKRIDEALKGMTPEEREAVKDLPMFGGAKKAKPVVKCTDKKREILGQMATLYLITKGQEVKGIWASDADRQFVRKFREISESFKSFMPDDDEMDEMDLIPGKYWLEEVDFDGDNVNVRRIKEMAKGNPPDKAFYIPGAKEGFTHGSMIDMMMQGQQRQ